MISIEAATGIVRGSCRVPAPVETEIGAALGRVVATDVTAGEEVPPFDRAMMDGFAVRADDVREVPVTLAVIDEVPAGTLSSVTVHPGAAARIMTGAPLPPGADAVQMKEVCRELPGGRVEVLEPVRAWKNVARRGCECARGATVLEKGVPIGPAHLGALATLGFARLPVVPAPTIRLLNTGSELVDVSQPITGGQIRNSNRHTLTGLLRVSGFAPAWGGAVRDEPGEIRRAVEASEAADVLLLTGGVSVGEYDLVGEAVAAAGWDVLFRAVAIKPGKPLVFARKGARLLFGLSGNPVSSFLQCALFVLPALRAMAGWSRPGPDFTRARLAAPAAHNPGRVSFKPGRLRQEGDRVQVQPVSDRGSADLFAWSNADCAFLLPADAAGLDAGALTEVFRLPGAGQ
ncbi:MAG: molybdopterin molybdotransferase MoeA [Acidobacteria bacterium]|nr:molybdopterin molybdotransferase MoeA [Acidobacteriota bacterium]